MRLLPPILLLLAAEGARLFPDAHFYADAIGKPLKCVPNGRCEPHGAPDSNQLSKPAHRSNGPFLGRRHGAGKALVRPGSLKGIALHRTLHRRWADSSRTWSG